MRSRMETTLLLGKDGSHQKTTKAEHKKRPSPDVGQTSLPQ